MTEQDEIWKPTSRESWQDLEGRIDAFFAWIVTLPEENIVVVSHGVWIEACFRRYQPSVLGSRRVYNLDAFGMECVSTTDTQQQAPTAIIHPSNYRFVRIQNVCQVQA